MTALRRGCRATGTPAPMTACPGHASVTGMAPDTLHEIRVTTGASPPHTVFAGPEMASLGAGSPFHQKETEMNTSETAGMTTGAVTSRDGPRTGYPPLGQGPDATVTQAGHRRRLLTVPGVTGIAFTLSWIAGLAIPAPSPKLTASGAGIAAAFAGHQAAVVAQFALTEGLPAAGLAIVSVVLARAARRSGAAAAARFACIAGVAAAGISLAQFVLGMVLAGTSAPGTAHLLYDAVNRLDGAKMFALAAFGLRRRRVGDAAPVAAVHRDRARPRHGLLRPPLPATPAGRCCPGVRVRAFAAAVHHRHRHRAGHLGR